MFKVSRLKSYLTCVLNQCFPLVLSFNRYSTCFGGCLSVKSRMFSDVVMIDLVAFQYRCVFSISVTFSGCYVANIHSLSSSHPSIFWSFTVISWSCCSISLAKAFPTPFRLSKPSLPFLAYISATLSLSSSSVQAAFL